MRLIQHKSSQWAVFLLFFPVLTFGAAIESEKVEETKIGEEDSDELQKDLNEINASDTPDFLRDGSVILRSTWYSRHRSGYPTLDMQSPGDRDFNVLGLGLDISSGYLWGIVGFDLGLYGNIKVGPTTGQSEILYYDYYTGQEKSELAIGRASLKFKFGDDANGFKANVGYTPINVGTIGTSSGLHSHAYRGFEAKYTFHDFEIGYGWADQFHNEWTTQFIDLSTSPYQNQPPYENTGQRIDYIHSLGLRYVFGPKKEGFVDVGIGQGKGYRNNQQIAASYTFDLDTERSLKFTGYYFQGQYNPELSGISDPTNEWHSSVGATYKQGGWSLFAGYGKTHAPNSGELNFALTPFGNSDDRNFIQTTGQLDDYVWDGEQVVKVGVDYEVGRLINLPGLVTGVSYNYGWNLKNYDANGKRNGRSKISEIDAKLVYTVPKGKLKGLSAGVYVGRLRGDSDFYGKPHRNDIKFILSYELKLF